MPPAYVRRLCRPASHCPGAHRRLPVTRRLRLAPEFMAPQGVWDCVDAMRWLGADAGPLGGDAERLAVCGDSAGGNLAAVVSMVLRDEGGPRVAHQALLYPGVDATMSFPSVAALADAPMLTRREIVAYLHRYLDGSGLDPKDPLVSPLWADDLSGLPPALVQTRTSTRCATRPRRMRPGSPTPAWECGRRTTWALRTGSCRSPALPPARPGPASSSRPSSAATWPDARPPAPRRSAAPPLPPRGQLRSLLVSDDDRSWPLARGGPEGAEAHCEASTHTRGAGGPRVTGDVTGVPVAPDLTRIPAGPLT